MLLSSPKACPSIFFTSFLNSLLEPGTLLSLTQQVITTCLGLPGTNNSIALICSILGTRTSTYPFPTGQQPGLISAIQRMMPILASRGISPSLMLSRGGDRLTSVPPLMRTTFSQPIAVKTGMRHCIMRVQLAAVLALIQVGSRNLGQKQTSESPTLGNLSVKAEKTLLSWLLMPGLGLFFLMLIIVNCLLRMSDRASELRIICPPPSYRHPSISTIYSILLQ